MKVAFDLLSDSNLISHFRDLLIAERSALVRQLELLAELDRRKLTFAYPSLWACLVHEFGMAEWEAERKIRAARLLARFPDLVRAEVESGKLNLSLLELASRVGSRERLSDSELSEILESLSGLSVRQARREIAARYPEPAEDHPDRVIPISEDLSEVRFVASSELLEKLGEIKGLLAHSHPGIGMAGLIDVLATEYRTRHHPEEKAKRADARQQAKRTEVVRSPVTLQGVKAAVVEKRTPGKTLVHELIRREGGYACAYVDPVTKKKCTSNYALEIDHVIPWSKGGGTELKNLRFLCPGHHRRVSFTQFGSRARYRVWRPAPA